MSSESHWGAESTSSASFASAPAADGYLYAHEESHSGGNAPAVAVPPSTSCSSPSPSSSLASPTRKRKYYVGMARFQNVGRVGDGAYGIVYKAVDRNTDKLYALKKVRSTTDREGFPLTSVREIKLLKRFQHKNIVKLHEVVHAPEGLFLVFEYCQHDLASLLEERDRPFSAAQIKCLMLQMFEAVNFLHENFVIHRDIKLSNMLYTDQGRMVLADFGLARIFRHPLDAFTPNLVTLWYRAPELLLGTEKYHTAADMWSVGCVFAELIDGKPLFCADREFDQLHLIYQMLGTPNEGIWPGFNKLSSQKPEFRFPRKYSYQRITAQYMDKIGKEGVELMLALLCYDPAKRITADQALRHPYFKAKPKATPQALMPSFKSMHPTERDRKRQRRTSTRERSGRRSSSTSTYSRVAAAYDHRNSNFDNFGTTPS